MKYIKIPLIIMAVLLFYSGVSYSQITNEYKQCSQVSHSTVDEVEIVSVEAKPEDTLWMPFSIKNFDNPNTDYEEFVTAFIIQITYNDTFLTPILTPGDPNGDITVVEAGRLKTAINKLPESERDGRLVAQISQNPIDDGALIIQFNLAPLEFYEPPKVTAGSGVVFLLPFLVDPNIPDGKTLFFDFHEINECIVIGSDIFCANCRLSEFGVRTIDSTFFNTDTGYEDTVFFDVPVYPSLTTGTYTANDFPPPAINQFYPENQTISTGGVTLFWDVLNVDSINITGPNLVYETISAFNSATSVIPPQTNGTYTYTLKAFGFDSKDSSIATTYIIFDADDTGDPDPDPTNAAPVISVASAFTVEEGAPLSFSVSASDSDGDNITLSAQAPLPNNSNFTTVMGVGSVTGTFSWTPDIDQNGFYNITFSATDGSKTTNSTVGITVTKIQGDRIFSTSSLGQAPVGGLKGKKNVLLPIDLVTSQTVYGIQFDFVYDYQYFEIDSFVVTDRTPDYVIYDNIGQTPGIIRVVTFGLANEPIVTDNSTAIMYAAMSIDSTAPPGDYPVFIQDGWESINPDPSFPSLELLVDDAIIQVDLPGDVNLDKRIDVADLVSMVAYIIGEFGLPERQFDVSDVIYNDTVDVFDLVGIINLLYGIPIESGGTGQSFATGLATVELDYSDILIGQTDKLVVKSDLPVEIGGVQLEILYDPSTVELGKPETASDASNLTMNYKDNGYGKMVVLMYFNNPFDEDALVSAGTADLINVPIIAHNDIEAGNEAQIKLSRVLLSTGEAATVSVEGFTAALPETFALKQNYPNPFNPITTIEFSLGTGSSSSGLKDVTLDIYNVLGQHVKALLNDALPPGNYNVEWDATNESGIKTATGIYLYRLKVGSEIQTKKMLLLK